MPGLLFVVSGPSGVGKSTILEKVVKDDVNLKFSISATTRKPRPGEVDKFHYFFISFEEFENKIKAGEFLEWAEIYHDRYGTPKDFVFKTLEHGKDCVLELDVQGALQVVKKYKDAITIFIAPKSKTDLLKRLKGRSTEDDIKIGERLKFSSWELKNIDKYKYLIVNDDLEKAIGSLKDIIRAERSLVTRQAKRIDKLKFEG